MTEKPMSGDAGPNYHRYAEDLYGALIEPPVSLNGEGSRPPRRADQIHGRVVAFFDALATEGDFAWLGLTEYTDALGSPRRALYALGRLAADPHHNPHFDPAQPDLSIAFTELSVVLEDLVPLDFYYIDEGRYQREAKGVPVEVLVTGQTGAAMLRWQVSLVG